MALNYSQRPIFPAHTSEDNLVAPDPLPADIIDLLPSDPFGMDIDISTTFTAITGWLEGLEVDYAAYFRNNIVNTNEDYGLFGGGLNLFWNDAMRFQSFPNNDEPNDKSGAGCRVREYVTGYQFRGVEVDSVNPPITSVDGIMSFDNASTSTSVSNNENRVIHPTTSVDGIMSFDNASTSTSVSNNENLVDGFDHSFKAVEEDPHDAFVLALSYLGTRDLIFAECVSRSLCTTIRNDSLLWHSICITQPGNERITDDMLVQLTSRAEGNLLCLTLIKCPKITDDGLRRVLEANPKLTKLSVPGCTRLSSEGLLHNLKAFQSSKSGSGIKRIRCRGLYGITHEQFIELKSLLGSDGNMQQNVYTPHYYVGGDLHLPSDDDNCDIDVDVCHRCQNVRLVYDCPAESCQVKDRYGADLCRACIICIPRCCSCGRCLQNSEYEETFSLENRCSRCKEQQMDVDVSLQG